MHKLISRTHNYNGINLLDKALIEYLIDKREKKHEQADKSNCV